MAIDWEKYRQKADTKTSISGIDWDKYRDKVGIEAPAPMTMAPPPVPEAPKIETPAEKTARIKGGKGGILETAWWATKEIGKNILGYPKMAIDTVAPSFDKTLKRHEEWRALPLGEQIKEYPKFLWEQTKDLATIPGEAAGTITGALSGSIALPTILGLGGDDKDIKMAYTRSVEEGQKYGGMVGRTPLEWVGEIAELGWYSGTFRLPELLEKSSREIADEIDVDYEKNQHALNLATFFRYFIDLTVLAGAVAGSESWVNKDLVTLFKMPPEVKLAYTRRGIDPNLPMSEVNKAIKKQLTISHPDKIRTGSEIMTKQINNDWGVIKEWHNTTFLARVKDFVKNKQAPTALLPDPKVKASHFQQRLTDAAGKAEITISGKVLPHNSKAAQEIMKMNPSKIATPAQFEKEVLDMVKPHMTAKQFKSYKDLLWSTMDDTRFLVSQMPEQMLRPSKPIQIGPTKSLAVTPAPRPVVTPKPKPVVPPVKPTSLIPEIATAKPGDVLKNKVLKHDDLKFVGDDLKVAETRIAAGAVPETTGNVLVTPNKEGTFTVLDGHQRIVQAVNAGRKEIVADIEIPKPRKKIEPKMISRAEPIAEIKPTIKKVAKPATVENIEGLRLEIQDLKGSLPEDIEQLKELVRDNRVVEKPIYEKFLKGKSDMNLWTPEQVTAKKRFIDEGELGTVRDLIKKGEFDVKPQKTGFELRTKDNKYVAPFRFVDKVAGEKPVFGKQELKTILKESPEFRTKPDLYVVDYKGGKGLQFKSDKHTFTIKADALGLKSENLKVGDHIKVDAESLRKPGDELRVKKYASGKEEEYASLASKGSRKSINSMIARTAKKAPDVPKDFVLSKEVKNILADFDVPIAERSIYRSKYLGIYKHQPQKIRVQALTDVTTVVHEVTHALDKRYGLTDKIISGTTHGDSFRRELTNLYEALYPTARRTHSLNKRMTEGLAALVEHYFYNPAEIVDKYPMLVEDIIAPGGRFYHPEIQRLLTKVNNLVGEYSNLTPEQRIASRIIRGDEIIKRDKGFNIRQRLVYEFFTEAEPLIRYAERANILDTIDDPTVHYFMWQNRNAMIGSWWKGDGAIVPAEQFGNFDLLDGLNIKSYLEKIAKVENGDRKFDSFLAARRAVHDYNKMIKLEGAAIKARDELKEMIQLEKDGYISEGMGDDIESLKEIIQAYQRQKGIVEKDNWSMQDANATVAEYEGTTIEEATEIYDKINDALLLFSKRTNLITPEQYEIFLDDKGYASFMRFIDDEISSTAIGNIGPEQVKPSSFKARTGSELMIISPMYNQLRAIQEVITKGLEQRMWGSTRDLAKKNVSLARHFEKVPTVREVGSDGRISYPQIKDPGLIQVLNKGKREFFKAAPEFLAVRKNMTPKEFEQFSLLLRLPASVFTRLTTSANPFFALGNITVDQFSAWAQTQTKLKPFLSPFSNVPKMVKNDPLFKKYKAIGGFRQTLAAFHDLKPEDMVKAMLPQKGIGKAAKIVDSGINVLELPSNWSEIMSRFTEYERMGRLKNATDTEAMKAAMDVTAPFQQHGHWFGKNGVEFVKALPYYNASHQVLYIHTKRARQQPGRIAMVGAALASASLLAAIAGFRMGTEEQKRILADMSVRELSRGLFIPSPTGKGWIRIRIPEQFGALNAIALMYVMQHYDGNKVMFDDLLEASTSWMPDQWEFWNPAKALLALTPQVLKPGISAGLGVKTYPEVRPILPYYFKYLPKEEQYFDYTSRLSKALGKIFNVSPAKIDYWVKQQFGPTGKLGYYLSSGLMFANTQDVANGFPYNPLYRKEFYLNSGRSAQRFFDEKDIIDNQYKNIDNYSVREKIHISSQKKLYDDVGDIMKVATEYSKDREIPKDVRQELFEILVLLQDDKVNIGTVKKKVVKLRPKINRLERTLNKK